MKVRVRRSFLAVRLNRQRPLVFYQQVFRKTAEGPKTVCWRPENRELPDDLPPDAFFETPRPAVLAILSPLPDSEGDDTYVQVELIEFEPYDPDHLHALFQAHYLSVKVLHEPLGGRELPWFMTRYPLVSLQISNVLAGYDPAMRGFCLNEMKRIGPLLSPEKQRALGELLHNFGINYSPLEWKNLKKALERIIPWQVAKHDSNMFHYLAAALYSPSYSRKLASLEPEPNLFVNLLKWLYSDEFVFTDFGSLLKVLSPCGPYLQLLLLRRYFRAVELQQTHFDPNVLRGFVSNRFDIWNYWHQCFADPMLPVQIGVKLLAGAVLHALAGGKDFTAERLIDFARRNCCHAMPKVDFGLFAFFRYCDCGIVETHDFKGFVCYSLLMEIDVESIDATEKLRTLASEFFASKAKRDEGGESWTLYSLTDEEFELLDLFMRQPIYPLDMLTVFERDLDFDPARFGIRLNQFLNSHFAGWKAPDGRIQFEVKDKLSPAMKMFCGKVMRPCWILAEPKKNVSFGNTMISAEIGMTDDEYIEWSKKNAYTVPLMENRWLRNRVSGKLRNISGCKPDRYGRFAIPYSKEMLERIKQVFQVSDPGENSENLSEPGAVYTVQENASPYLCLPDKASEPGARYVVCHGRKCFCHAYYTERTWREYGLMDFMRILNENYVEKAPFGEIPSRLLCEMGRELAKAEKIFPSLACPYCGHLRAKSSTGTLRCVNPDCPGKRHS